jgi:hypothetical protein
MYDEDGEGLGAGFWFRVLGIAAAGIIAGFLILILFGRAWYAWGFFGAFLVFSLILIGVAWIYDRRHADRGDDYVS